MSDVNRIIITCRLESGDSLDLTAKAVNRNYSADDVKLMRSKIEKQFAPRVDDTLYYQVRVRSGVAGKTKRNWSRVKSLEALDEIIQEVMVHESEETAS